MKLMIVSDLHGSAAMPKKDSPRGYLILEDRCFQWKTLDGTVWKTEFLGKSGDHSGWSAAN